MLNVILIFSVLFNLAVGFLFIAGFDPVVWGKCGFLLPKDPNGSLEWDHPHFYLPEDPEEDQD